MKAMHTREFYEANWSRFIKRVPGGTYMNLDAELESAMRCYRDAELNEQALGIIEKMEAQKIIASADQKVRKQMATIKAVEAGRSSFGYTTQAQEIQARYEFKTRFEFNCLQVAIFRERYLAE